MVDWVARMRLRHLDALIRLAQTRNISQSAHAMHTTQPALSKWLKELEADLGLPLFERHARGMRPTHYGIAIAAHAKRIVAHLDAMRADMTALRDGGTGRIALGTSGATAGSTAPLSVLKMTELFPHAAIELVESPIDNLLGRLSQGELDVVVGRPHPGVVDLGLHSERLQDDTIAFIVRPGHPLTARPKLEWPDILGYRWIVWPMGSLMRMALDQALAAHGFAVPTLSMQSSAVTFNLTLLTNSDMICLASQRDASRYADWGIASQLPVMLPASAEITMYWRDDGDSRPILTAMLDCLRETATNC